MKQKSVYDPEAEFLKVFKHLCMHHSGDTVWQDFIVMSACAVSCGAAKFQHPERGERYQYIAEQYTEEERSLFSKLMAHLIMALEQNPEQDFLGHLFMTLELHDKKQGQIFTPYSIAKMTADILVGDELKTKIEQAGFITISDPCCGAGAMLIASVHAVKRTLAKENIDFQRHVLIAAQDIDETVALMCYLQLSLLGIAGYVKIGNSLTDSMTECQSPEHYWLTPIYFSGVWIEQC